MARIIGGIGCSHSPTIGFAFDKDKRDDPAFGPIFEIFKPVQDWLAAKKPDALILIYNDHVTSFFFDHYSAFTLGIGDTFEVADEGGGPRALPPISGHPALAAHIGMTLASEEFDMSFFQGRGLDHGFFSPLSMMWPHEPEWPGKVIPLQVGVLQFPVPSAMRCWKMGIALRKAIESYPEDIGVCIVATGGLSHQVHGERAGFNNVPWDEKFLDLIENDPLTLANLRLADYARLGGIEGAEVIMWLIMRGALSANVRKIHQSYYLPSMTGLATAIYEDTGDVPMEETIAATRAKIGYELAGVEDLPGTHPFTLERSVRGYRINHFLHALTIPEHRARFRADPEGSFETAKLSAEERDLIRRRDWLAMIHYGVIFFMLEKLAAVTGGSNTEIYAALRGETVEQFQKSRNATTVYSVAGTDSPDLAWDKPNAAE